MAKKIAINGFGRIGRLTFRKMFDNNDFEIVAINDLTNPKTLAHLLKYDTAHGQYNSKNISATDNSIIVDGKEIKIFAEKDPENLDWKSFDVDIVIESTGFFASKEASEKHLKAGAKKVVISAPAKGDLKTIVYNVNHEILDSNDKIISAASCTTNCLAPAANILEKEFGIESGFMTTIHAYTGDQRLQDAPHGDLRRARAGALNMVPTTTGAAVAVGKVLPNLNGKLDGMAVRVPTITGSLVDLVITLKDKNATIEKVNAAFEKHANETIDYVVDPIVSSDIIGSSFGSLFDSLSTSMLEVDGNKKFKIILWYDNEMSYVSQLIRTVKYFSNI